MATVVEPDALPACGLPLDRIRHGNRVNALDVRRVMHRHLLVLRVPLGMFKIDRIASHIFPDIHRIVGIYAVKLNLRQVDAVRMVLRHGNVLYAPASRQQCNNEAQDYSYNAYLAHLIYKPPVFHFTLVCHKPNSFLNLRI